MKTGKGKDADQGSWENEHSARRRDDIFPGDPQSGISLFQIEPAKKFAAPRKFLQEHAENLARGPQRFDSAAFASSCRIWIDALMAGPPRWALSRPSARVEIGVNESWRKLT
jgi:hypothetical protein